MAVQNVKRGRKAALALNKQVKHTLGQVEKTTAHNAKLQGAVANGSVPEKFYDGALSNPYKVHESEKYNVLETVRERVKTNLKINVVRALKERVQPGLVQIKAFGDWAKAEAVAAGIRNELSGIIVKLGQTKIYGWQVQRITETWGLLAKNFLVNADAVARIEAPAIFKVGMYVSTEGHIVNTTADLVTVETRDELHRLSDQFGLDAKAVTLLVKELLTIRTEGGVAIAANEAMELSAKLGIDLTANEPIKASSPAEVTLTTGTACIQVLGSGIVNINPVAPVPLAAATDVAPITLIAPASRMREKEMRPQYDGASGHAATGK